MIPSIGRIVHYRLSQRDADAINKRRADMYAHIEEHQKNSNGVQIHFGNTVHAGEVYPLVITRIFGDNATEETGVNGQVLLDGNDTFWATSRHVGTEEGTFFWPRIS